MKYLMLALLLGCSETTPDGANPDPKCHPLAVGDCMLPWPSSFYLKADSSTATGFRVALPEGVLPKDPTGKSMDTTALNRLDGFSPAGMLVANLKVILDRAQLPPENDLARSLDPAATVQLIEFESGKRVLHFAEVDNNAFEDEDQVLLIHPQIRLLPKTRYLVVLQKLVDKQGNKVVNQPFEALKSGATVRGLDGKTIFDKIAAAGLSKSDITLAWDFVTGSDEQLTGQLIGMRDQAMATWESMNLGYAVTEINDPTDDHLLRELIGTFEVPSFLASDALESVLQYDSDGKPRYRAPQNFPLVVHVPKCAETATSPLPFMVFGHGLFGEARSEMNSSYQKRVIDELCMVQVGTDWIGLSDSDIPNVVKYTVADFSRVDIVTDRLQQAQINFVILARLAIQKLKDDPNLQLNGKPISDGSQIYYYGISQGGIEGGTFMSITPDVLRGVLNVPGAAYSFMVTRSVDFRMLKGALNATYPVQRDQEVLLAVAQSYFDYSDPITFAPYSVLDPLPNLDGSPLPPRRILMQEAIHDTQVPNLSTRVAVRSMGIPLLETPVESVYGIETKAGPLDSAYTQWDVKGDDLSNGNTPPLVDNEVHGAIRKLPALIEQLRQFFRPDGQVVHTCTGPCIYDAP